MEFIHSHRIDLVDQSCQVLFIEVISHLLSFFDARGKGAHGAYVGPDGRVAVLSSDRLGICCIDLSSTATFGNLSDFASITDALKSPQATELFAELSNGIATREGCQICLADQDRICVVDCTG